MESEMYFVREIIAMSFSYLIVAINNKPNNIASRAAKSNSVYVSVLKIPIVLADGVNNFFFRARGPCQRGEKYYVSLQ